ncbi:MAG: hypothetical protein JWN93_3042 [Hyphomicrobiales bacterium]|nr:hypothetical protein [Hyphomicrobiales bacterium]
MTMRSGAAAMQSRAGSFERLRAFCMFLVVTDVELIASSIAYNAMLGFFPGLVLLKYLQDVLGYRFVTFSYANELSSIAPQPVIDLTNAFLSHVADIDRVTLSLSVVLFVLLVLKSVAGTFTGFLALMDRLTGNEGRLFRDKATTGAAAICVLFFSTMLFVVANLEALTNPGWLVAQEIGQALHVRFLASVAVVVVGMAAFFRILAGKAFSPRATWLGAALTTALWLGGCFVVFSYRFDFAEEQRLYGSVAATVAMLSWFYITAYTILIGMAFSYFVVDGKKSP